MIRLELKTNYKKLILFILIAVFSFVLVCPSNYMSLSYTLTAMFLSLNIGSIILTKETNNKTIEFLYSKPLSKKKITFAKIISGIMMLMLFFISTMLINFLVLKFNNNLNLKLFLEFICKESLMIAFSYAFSLFISTFCDKNDQALNFSMFFILIEYIIFSISKKYSAFKYFTFFSIYEKVTKLSLILSLVLILLLLILTIVSYNRKEFKNG